MVEIQLTDGNNADGNTPAPTGNTEAAQIAAMHAEAKKGFRDFIDGKTPEATSDKPMTVQPSVTPTQTPEAGDTKPVEAGDKVEVPKQFQAKDGTLDEGKILKSTQNQEQLNAKKREMLERYKALQREGSQIDKSIKEVKPKEEETAAPKAGQDFNEYLNGELTKEEIDVIEANKNEPLVRALLKAQAALAKVSTEDIRRKVEMSEAQSRDVAMLDRLDKLATNHSWLYTDEGQKRLEEVFKEDPGLWKTRDPYGYAVERLSHEMAPKTTQSGQARPAGTPMLGVGHALPPSTSQSITPSQELEKISHSVLSNLDNRAELRKAEQELRNKFRNIVSGR